MGGQINSVNPYRMSANMPNPKRVTGREEYQYEYRSDTFQPNEYSNNMRNIPYNGSVRKKDSDFNSVLGLGIMMVGIAASAAASTIIGPFAGVLALGSMFTGLAIASKGG